MTIDFDPATVGAVLGPMATGFTFLFRGLKRLENSIRALPCHPQVQGSMAEDAAETVLDMTINRCPAGFDKAKTVPQKAPAPNAAR